MNICVCCSTLQFVMPVKRYVRRADIILHNSRVLRNITNDKHVAPAPSQPRPVRRQLFVDSRIQSSTPKPSRKVILSYMTT